MLANWRARELLQGKRELGRVLFTEGEPDFVTWACRWDGPIFGVNSGSWTEQFAEKIPLGSVAIVRTHCDKAGDQYAELIASTLKERAFVRRLVDNGAG